MMLEGVCVNYPNSARRSMSLGGFDLRSASPFPENPCNPRNPRNQENSGKAAMGQPSRILVRFGGNWLGPNEPMGLLGPSGPSGPVDPLGHGAQRPSGALLGPGGLLGPFGPAGPMWAHVGPCTLTHTYMHACMHTYMHACIHAFMHACLQTYIHTYIYSFIPAFIHSSIHS